MNLRDYRPADFSTVCLIDRTCFPPGLAYPPQDLAYWMREPGAFVIVALDQNDEDRDEASARASASIAAFILARAIPGGEGHIVTIDVLPEYRRKGVATALMESAHARLREKGSREVYLETSVENSAGIAFYRKLGYRAVAQLPRYYLGRIDAWRMIKPL